MPFLSSASLPSLMAALGPHGIRGDGSPQALGCTRRGRCGWVGFLAPEQVQFLEEGVAEAAVRHDQGAGW